MPQFFEMIDPVQHYSWGSRSVLAQMQGRPSPTEQPEAELWIGAHRSAPSQLVLQAGPQPLNELLLEEPERFVRDGDQVVADDGSLPFLLKGAWWTVVLSLSGMFFGLLLGFGLALLRLYAFWPLQWLARVYVSFFRGTPLLVQLFMIYYGLPQLGIQLDPLPAALIGFSLNMAAYTAEILRAAIASIDRGQWEAAASIGMGRAQTLYRAILPQAARTALPPLGNSFISLVKDTALAATIQVPELFRQAQLITARTFEIFTMYLAAALIYWLLASVLAYFQGRLEHRVNRHEQDA